MALALGLWGAAAARVPAGIAGVALAAVLVAALFLDRQFIRRIDGLGLAIEGLRRGENGPVAAEGAGELGRLAGGFNRMAAEVRDREISVSRAAFRDRETGLGVAAVLERDISDRSPADGESLYVAALGLDRFARLREAIGEGRVGEVVREMGARLTRLEPGAEICRLAPDIIALALSAPDSPAAEGRVAALVEALEQPLTLGPDTIAVTFTAGIARMEPGETIVGARMALEQARAERRKLGVVPASRQNDPASNLALMSGMLWAIRSGEVELFYQPRFDLRRRRVDAVEALVRWRHPTRGLLRPDMFIPMAEATGHIRTLSDWVLRQAIADQAALGRLGHEIDVSINISGRVLADPGFAHMVERNVERAAGRLCFEITEAAVAENPSAALAHLERYREAGVSIAVDDYGKGSSSLGRLKSIGGHELKLDESLVADIAENQREALVVRSAIDLAHGLGMRVTAEGVETANTFQLLTAMGCDAIQGYLIAKPQPLNELLIFLREDGETRGFG